MSALRSVALAGALSFAAMAAAAPDPGVEAFGKVYKVLMSPRCMNCHPNGDRPLQHDDSRPHAMEVGRRATKLGLDCNACHQKEAMPGAHMPPGAPNWNLPPEKTPMVFQGKSPAELCKQLKNPEQTHGKDLKALHDHVAHDELVAWGWAPGEGRTPVSMPKEEFVAAFKTWIDAGAPCP